MFKTVLVLFNAAALLLAATAPAHAGPLAAGVVAFMASPFGQIVVGIGAMLLSGVIKGLFGSKQAQKVTGTQLSVRMGGDGPFSFPLGPAAAAGTRFYVGSWGNPGEAPNAFYVEAFAVSDLPISGWLGWWANDQRAAFGAYDTTLGYPILDFRRNGVDHAWIKHYRGAQLSPDPYLRAKFGSHPVYPYGEDMVGRGVAYYIVTTRRPGPDDQDLLSSPIKVLPEPGPIMQYDLRKDSTVGGSGLHRWGDHSTYEPSSNLMVQAYNVARGIHYNGEWIFGGQNWPAFRLPASSWMAAMNACDLSIPLVDGGTEPQFHGGGMVDVSEIDPASLLNELFKSASAKSAEAGGVYKVRVGAPGIPVMHFTDEDIVVTREHGWAPFKGIGETHNTVNWTYSEPQERWANKPGPQYKDAALVASDRGRTLPMSFDVPWTQSNTTGQRLVQAALKNSRRMDTHVMSMPPIAWLLEALDTVSWTSSQAGYEAKEFEIDEAVSGADLIPFVSIRENDPSDYSWTPSTDQRAYAIAPMLTIRPAPQAVSGEYVSPVPGEIAYDAHWSPSSVGVDVEFVRVSHRLPGDTNARWTGLVPKPALLTGEGRISQNLTRATLYEVQIEYVPYSGRATIASDWMPVTTSNVKLGPDDIDITFADIAGQLIEDLKWISTGVRAAMQNFERFGSLLAEQDLANFNDREVIRRELRKKVGDLEASFTEIIEVALGPGGAIAQKFEAVYAALGGNSAQVLVRFQAMAAPDGVTARWAVQVSSDGAVFASAGIFIDLFPDGTSRIVLDASQTVISKDGGATVMALFNEDGLMVRDITAAMISSADGYTFLDLTGNEWQFASPP